MPRLLRNVGRVFAVLRARLGIRAGLQQQRNHLLVTTEGRFVDGLEASLLYCIGVGSVAEK